MPWNIVVLDEHLYIPDCGEKLLPCALLQIIFLYAGKEACRIHGLIHKEMHLGAVGLKSRWLRCYDSRGGGAG